MALFVRIVCGFVCALLALTFVGGGPFSWIKKDSFDVIMDKMTAVNAENCRSKPRSELELSKETTSHVPVYNKLLNTKFFSNRSMLMHMHNMALNRAFYYSFIYQRMNTSGDFQHQPGLMYLYMSAAADVSASEGFINASSLLFDNNCSYANWYISLEFNTTLPLFGVRAFREDDYADPNNYLREPTNRTVVVEDYAAGRVTNYTAETYKYLPYSRYEYDPGDTSHQTPLYWWPDNNAHSDSIKKHTYNVGIRFSRETGKFLNNSEYTAISILGPPSPGQQDKDIKNPVLFTPPYYDCGRTNKWIVTMTAPVVEYMHRYVNWTHLRRPK